MTHLVNTISPEVQNTGVRDGRIDSVKFWLVFLVITAHVIMRKEFTGSTACVALWNWLCLFAMPLFIFISGYYSRKKDWQSFWPSIWKQSEPLIIFQVIGLLFYVDEPLTIRSVLTPWYSMCHLWPIKRSHWPCCTCSPPEPCCGLSQRSGILHNYSLYSTVLLGKG